MGGLIGELLKWTRKGKINEMIDWSMLYQLSIWLFLKFRLNRKCEKKNSINQLKHAVHTTLRKFIWI